MNQKLTWDFVSTGGGRDDGINNPLIEQFSGNYNYSLAREVIQNSLDAKVKGSAKPVTVIFNLDNFSRGDFPDLHGLLEVMTAGKKYYKDDLKAQEFLENASNCLNENPIPFLRISDFNTTGLLGNDNDKKGGWYNLVKATGSSPKVEGGGSFGIGKGAPFAASNLRVVFYSTLKKDGFTKFQGIAELVSHESKGDIKRGVGSYGIGQGSVTNPKDIPGHFWRKEPGTDIFIAGYKNDKGWQKNLIQSILRNFWYAIYRNDLVVRVENDEIKQGNLEDYLIQHFMTEPFKDYVKPTGNPLQYYLAVKNGMLFEKKLQNLGNVRFHFYQTEEHLNYVAMMRDSHMVIYSRRFNFPGNYAGVFICDDDKGSLILRKMEPPAHDEWIPERYKEKGTKVMDEIIAFIRGCLDQMKISKTSGILDIPELHKYLPYDDGEDIGEGSGSSEYTGEESEEESSKQIQRREVFEAPAVVNPYRVSVLNKSDTGAGEENGSGSGKGKGSGSGNSGGGGKGKKRVYIKEKIATRSFLLNRSASSLEYRIIVKSQIDEKCNLKIMAIGEEGSEKLQIKKVIKADGIQMLHTGDTIRSVYLENGKDLILTVFVESSIKYSLKIEAYVLQQ